MAIIAASIRSKISLTRAGAPPIRILPRRRSSFVLGHSVVLFKVILRLLVENRFPAIWQPSVANAEQRQLLLHRCQLVRMRARIKPLLRWLPVKSALQAQRKDPSWHRQYVRLSMNKHHGVAKVAIAHKLAVRLYWMLRSGQNYMQMMERGSHAGQSVRILGCGFRPSL